MTWSFWYDRSAELELLVLVGVPIMVFALPAWRGGRKSLGGRFGLSVFAVWIGLILHRDFIGFPAALASAAARGNTEYDGVGMNGMVLMLGWLLGIIATTPVWLVFLACRWWWERRSKSGAQRSA